MAALARHVLAEYYGCEPGLLDDPARLQPLLEAAVRAAKAVVIKTQLHHFSPQGVSGVVILAESHLAVHTWPEHGYAAVEIFTCGDHTDPAAGHRYLLQHLKPAHHTVQVLERGDLRLIQRFPPPEVRTAFV
jgi:S-adenosylmethionine decarboxylase proenzyme